MSALEVINEVRNLPMQEQEQVLNFLKENLRQHRAVDDDVKYADDADFKKAAEKIFLKHDNLFRRLAQ